MEYNKPALDIPAQIARLQQQGLTITDLAAAEQFLSHVSYFRFAAYLRPLEDNAQPRRFLPGTTFEQAVQLYCFDRDLRKLLFSAIQRIEISLRSQMIHLFSLAHGPFWFFDESLAADKHKFIANMSTIERELQRTQEDFIADHYTKYTPKNYPPAWKVLELVSFGCLGKLYYNFAVKQEKKALANAFGVEKPWALESWIRSLVSLRNACAHHARVWNRTMQKIPQLPATMPNKWLTDTRVDRFRPYAILCCIAYWLNAIDPQNTFVGDFKLLLLRYPTVNPLAMGVPQGWRQEALWQ